MKHLVIIGAGPRGLAVALRATMYSQIKVTIVDNEPLSTWTFPRMLSDIQMRSPITFDLTTFYPDLQQYSLSSFLGYKPSAFTQKEVEDSNIFCYRKDFVRYLTYIVEELKKKGVRFAKHFVTNVTETSVECSNLHINYDYLVMATGRVTQKPKLPSYLRNKELISLHNLHDYSWLNKPINILGSGQQSAELVEFLSRQKAKVTWIQKHDPKVKQYPVPSCNDWGLRTALGPYYSRTSINKPLYLKRVKEWGPSITPHINNILMTRKYKVLTNPSSTKDINLDAGFILASGFNPDIELLAHSFNIARNIYDPNLPEINKDFKSSSHSNIYFTGLLALRYDGPRQGSIISSASTAKTIMDSINHAGS